jgi:hypothetical protein
MLWVKDVVSTSGVVGAGNRSEAKDASTLSSSSASDCKLATNARGGMGAGIGADAKDAATVVGEGGIRGGGGGSSVRGAKGSSADDVDAEGRRGDRITQQMEALAVQASNHAASATSFSSFSSSSSSSKVGGAVAASAAADRKDTTHEAGNSSSSSPPLYSSAKSTLDAEQKLKIPYTIEPVTEYTTVPSAEPGGEPRKVAKTSVVPLVRVRYTVPTDL